MTNEDELNALYTETEKRLGQMSPVEITVKAGDPSVPLRYTSQDAAWVIQLKTPDKREGESTLSGQFVRWHLADYPTRIAGARGLPMLIKAVREQRERLDAGAERAVRETRDAFERLDAESKTKNEIPLP